MTAPGRGARCLLRCVPPPEITIRELAPDESDVLLHVFDALTPDQRFLRYGTPLPQLSPR